MRFFCPFGSSNVTSNNKKNKTTHRPPPLLWTRKGFAAATQEVPNMWELPPKPRAGLQDVNKNPTKALTRYLCRCSISPFAASLLPRPPDNPGSLFPAAVVSFQVKAAASRAFLGLRFSASRAGSELELNSIVLRPRPVAPERIGRLRAAFAGLRTIGRGTATQMKAIFLKKDLDAAQKAKAGKLFWTLGAIWARQMKRSEGSASSNRSERGTEGIAVVLVPVN